MLPSSTNIVIIGGGVLGTSAAFQLAKDGHQDILLLDRGPLANGTTPFAAGQTAYLSASPDRLPLTNYCLDFLENFAERTGYPIDFKQHGSLRIALTEAYLPELEAHQVAADGLGHELKSLTQKEIEKTLRTGNVPIKLVIQDKVGSVISKATDTAQFITLLQQQNISPRFNISKTTGRVSGISFNYQGIVYKGSTLGKNFSWNSIVKQIDYEQTRDRSVILSTNGKERGTDKIGEGNHNGTVKVEPRNNRTAKGTENSAQQSKSYVGEIKGNGMTGPLANETDWTPFKLELNDHGARKKSKRKKKRKGLGL